MRQGFEPWVGFNTYNALAKRRFRPLSHLTDECRGHKAEVVSPVKGKLRKFDASGENGAFQFSRRMAATSR